MLQKNKLTRVLMALLINTIILSTILQCNKKENKVELSFFKNDNSYSFFIETPETITFSSPSFFEQSQNNPKNKKNIIFEDELKKFKPLNLPTHEIKYDNIYISNSLEDTNFSINHYFEYDVQINQNGKMKCNIFYPYSLKGSYEFQINEREQILIKRALFGLPVTKLTEANNKLKFNSIIIINNKNSNSYVGDFLKTPNYSFIITVVNKILTENIIKQKIQNERYNIISSQYVKRFLPPPPPPIK